MGKDRTIKPNTDGYIFPMFSINQETGEPTIHYFTMEDSADEMMQFMFDEMDKALRWQPKLK